MIAARDAGLRLAAAQRGSWGPLAGGDMQKRNRWTTLCAALLTASVAQTARAQQEYEIEDPAQEVDDEYEEMEDDYLKKAQGPMSRIGTGVSIGAGVFGFLDETTTDFTDIGGNWTARISVGTRLPLTFEAAYIGSANDITALGLDDDALLVGNGVEGLLRFNFLSPFMDQIDLGFTRINPYIFGGIGWRNYQLTNEDFNTSNVLNDDNVGEIPAGGGFEMVFSQFVFDVRGEYRAAFDDELIGGADTDLLDEPGDDGLSSWGVTGRLGWEF
jgi:hypothetical protein